MPNIELRKSIIEEVDIAVPLIYSSGPPTFEYVFKNNKVSAFDFLSYAFVRKGGEFSFDNHYSLYLEDKMIGIGSVFGSKKTTTMTIKDGINILRFYGLKSKSVITNGLQVEKLIKLPKKNEIVLAHLGILPQFQGQGLGTKLIDKLMEKARTSTENNFILDVSFENPKAKALYERLGFSVVETMHSKLKNEFSYVASHYRMILK